MEQLNKIIVSEKSYNSSEAYDIIYSNITVVNLLGEEGIETRYLHPDAVASYYVDYYLAQYNNGNFSQFVWNTKWSGELNELIKKGLNAMGANKHLELFIGQSEKVANLPHEELERFLQSDYFGENATRDQLKNDAFYNLDEDLVLFNAQWLKNHPDLQVLSIDHMFLALEKFIGRPIEK